MSSRGSESLPDGSGAGDGSRLCRLDSGVRDRDLDLGRGRL